MKTIPLTNSEQVAIVDDLFYQDVLALGPWRLGAGGYVVMAIDARLGNRQLHRLILQLAGHNLEGMRGDHRDRNRLDNRLRNLRPATSRQNNMNRARQRRNKSGYIGVRPRFGRWQARVRANVKESILGTFDCPIEAAKAYDAALLAGRDSEFAVLNFPTS